jgi:hypothetical protein
MAQVLSGVMKGRGYSAAERKKRSAGELDDLLKQRDRTILDLRQEAEGREALVAELREHMQDAHELINSWIEAFDMELGDNGLWKYGRWVADHEAW